MQILNQYQIQFSGLNNEIYQFDFKIDKSFFEATAFPEVRSGDLTVHVELDKQINMMVLDFTIEGEVELMCDRCLDYFKYPLSIEEQLIVKQVVEAKESDDDNLIYIDMQAHTLDLVHSIYEYINVALPIQRFHPEDEAGNSSCDPEMIKKLKDFSQPIQNPQWNALNDLNQMKN